MFDQQLRFSARRIIFSSIADDPNGLAIPITISHFTPDLHLRGERLDRLLPIGTVLAIREPFVSLNHLAHGGPSAGKAQVGVRVDTPTDVVLVGEFHPMLRDVAWEGKLESSPVCVAGFEGAVAVTQLWTQEGKAQLAADEEAAQELIKSLLENRRPGAAYRALRAAQRSNSLASPELEARVLYALGQYSRAASVCEGALKSLDATRAPLPHAQLSAQLSRAQSRCDEESKGSFDIRAMYFQSQRVLAPRLDVADFVGRVRVEDVEGAGRGLILTHDVEPGELLLCCKAVGSAYPEDWDGLPVLRLNLETGITTTTSQVLAATNIIHTLIGAVLKLRLCALWPPLTYVLTSRLFRSARICAPFPWPYSRPRDDILPLGGHALSSALDIDPPRARS